MGVNVAGNATHHGRVGRRLREVARHQFSRLQIGGVVLHDKVRIAAKPMRKARSAEQGGTAAVGQIDRRTESLGGTECEVIGRRLVGGRCHLQVAVLDPGQDLDVAVANRRTSIQPTRCASLPKGFWYSQDDISGPVTQVRSGRSQSAPCQSAAPKAPAWMDAVMPVARKSAVVSAGPATAVGALLNTTAAVAPAVKAARPATTAHFALPSGHRVNDTDLECGHVRHCLLTRRQIAFLECETHRERMNARRRRQETERARAQRWSRRRWGRWRRRWRWGRRHRGCGRWCRR